MRTSRFLCAFMIIILPLSAEITEFQKLMGKGTKHWDHVSRPLDLQALETFEKVYERDKEKRFIQEGKTVIPQVIHFIWLGPKPFPPESVENVRSWIAKNPGWKVKFWTDRERLPPCNAMEVCDVTTFPFLFLRHCYHESENWGEKSDVLRFEILYQEGGVYADHDANCLQSFDGLHRGYDFYCGLEVPHPPVSGRNVTSGNGLIGAKPFHPIVGRVIELIGDRWAETGKKFRGRDGYSRTQLVMERTYMILTYALGDRFCEKGNRDIVFPAAYFFAKKGIPSLYSKHFFANAWADEDRVNTELQQKMKYGFAKMKRRNATIRWVGWAMIVINIVAFSFLFRMYIFRRRREQG